MAYIKAKCDHCNSFLLENEWNQDYDNTVLCDKCYIRDQLKTRIRERNEKMEWLERTHLKQIKELDKEISELSLKI